MSKKPNATSDAKPPTKSAESNPPAGEASSPQPRHSRTQVDTADSKLDEVLQALQYALLKQVETWPVLGVEPVAPAETKVTPGDR